MDVIEILTNPDQLTAYFQPIFSADEHTVVAYEVSAKFHSEKGLISLQTLADDQEIPEEYRIDIEKKILDLALSQLAQTDGDFDVYIPYNANLLVVDYGDGFFDTVKQYFPEDQLHRITIVISEHNFKGEIEQLDNILRYFRTFGIKIALNEVGPESHLDNIVRLSPHIIEICVKKLTYDSWGSQNDVINSISLIARKIGASVLYEAIDAEYQLQFAWKNGGRYYQGKYLADAHTSTVPADLLKNRFKNEWRSFIATEKRFLEQSYQANKDLQSTIEETIQRIKPAGHDVDQLLTLAKELEQYSFRLYTCDEDGFQTSPNIVYKDKSWTVHEKSLGKNWSWRPYFLKTIIQMRNDQKGVLSDVYSDIETGELTRTFSYPVAEHEYLFIDISYDYLYEHKMFQ